MEILLISIYDVTKFTPLGGNIDIDKSKPTILYVQFSVIEPLLGVDLYEKILTDFYDETLSGDYLELYENYIRWILIYQVFAEFVEVGSYIVDNGGIFKHQPTDSQIVEKSEVQYFAQQFRTKSQVYIERCKKWLCENHLPEYKICDTTNVRTSSGWYLK